VEVAGLQQVVVADAAAAVRVMELGIQVGRWLTFMIL
jgi:hypothetical protein